MRVQLRQFQSELKAKILTEWQRVKYVLAVSATGSGKTVLFSDLIADEPGAVCAIAHRQELVSQISLALARNGVRHRIIGSAALRKSCTALHMAELSANYIDPNNRVAVAGVDTLIGMPRTDPWFATVRLWVNDEAHHVQADNKWGTAIGMFPHARGLGVTATPCRADGRGLDAQSSDGIFNAMVVAPGMRDLINMGYLTDYRIFVPPSDLDLSDVTVTAGGDFSPVKLRTAVHRSHITGDVVAHYLRLAPGKLGITFAVDISEATAIAAAFRAAGVPAEVVSSKTPDMIRMQVLRKFRNRELMQLVNVDLFGEGFDLPAIEVVSMARPTQSFTLYAQQFGRALRLMDGKERAIIIDHVGNVKRHGLPDAKREWSMSRRDRRGNGGKPDENIIATTVCVECASAYERIYSTCPYCGHYAMPAERSAPHFVDGDLQELTADVLAKMRGEIDAGIKIPYDASPIVVAGIKNQFAVKQITQQSLRDVIALWAGWHRTLGKTDSEIYRLFFLTYGTDIMTAQTLNAKAAGELRNLLQSKLDESGVVSA